MTPSIGYNTEVDHELLELMRISPSLNSFEQKEREAITLRIVTLPTDKQLEVKDMLMEEQEDLAKANAEEMHQHYLELKQVYATLKEVKNSLNTKKRKYEEAKDRAAEAKEIEILEEKLEDEK